MHAKLTERAAKVTALVDAGSFYGSPRKRSALGPVFFFNVQMPPDFPAYADIKFGYRNLHGMTDIPGPHYHRGLEIGVIHKGRGAFLIGPKLTAFSTGDIFFLNGSVPHAAFYASQCICSWLYFDLKTFFSPLRAGAQTIDLAVMAQESFNNAFASRDYPELASLVNGLVHEFEKKQPCYQEAVRGRLFTILALMERLRITGDAHFPLQGVDSAREPVIKGLDQAIAFIHSHYSEKIGNEEMARAACMSITNFRHQFRRTLGMPPHVYLTTFRLRVACEGLRSSGSKIEAIAEACGFEDASSFRRAFKKAMHTTPAAWKQAAAKAGRAKTADSGQ